MYKASEDSPALPDSAHGKMLIRSLSFISSLLPPFTRMSPGMHPLQVADRHLGIARGRTEIGVAQDGLKVPDVCTVVQHVRGHGMSQQMAGAALGQPGPCQSPTDKVAQPMADIRLARVAQEYCLGCL